jgi:hypothetical protein
MNTERDVWQDVSINGEGVSVVTYSQAADQEPITEDESWWTWDELEALREEHQ